MDNRIDRKKLAQELEEYRGKSNKTYVDIANEIGEGVSADTLGKLHRTLQCGEEKCRKIAWYLRKTKLRRSEEEHQDTTMAIEVEEESTVDAMIKALQSREESVNPEGMTALTHEAREIVTSMSEKTGRSYKDYASALIEYAAKILKRYGKVLMD